MENILVVTAILGGIVAAWTILDKLIAIIKSGPKSEPVLFNVSGDWVAKNGPSIVHVDQDADQITGWYKHDRYDSRRHLKGEIDSGSIFFRWAESDRQPVITGIGYWDVQKNGEVLSGYWAHEEDVDTSLGTDQSKKQIKRMGNKWILLRS